MINRKGTVSGKQYDLVLHMCRQEVVRLVSKLDDITKWRSDSYDTVTDQIVGLDSTMRDIKDVAALHNDLSTHYSFVEEDTNG